MKRTLDRSIVVGVLFVGLLWLWTIVARTDWATTRSLLGAGPEYSNVWWPWLQTIATIVLVVIAVDWLRQAWRWFAVNVLHRDIKRRRVTRMSSG